MGLYRPAMVNLWNLLLGISMGRDAAASVAAKSSAGKWNETGPRVQAEFSNVFNRGGVFSEWDKRTPNEEKSSVVPDGCVKLSGRAGIYFAVLFMADGSGQAGCPRLMAEGDRPPSLAAHQFSRLLLVVSPSSSFYAWPFPSPNATRELQAGGGELAL